MHGMADEEDLLMSNFLRKAEKETMAFQSWQGYPKSRKEVCRKQKASFLLSPGNLQSTMGFHHTIENNYNTQTLLRILIRFVKDVWCQKAVTNPEKDLPMSSTGKSVTDNRHGMFPLSNILSSTTDLRKANKLTYLKMNKVVSSSQLIHVCGYQLRNGTCLWGRWLPLNVADHHPATSRHCHQCSRNETSCVCVNP